MTWGQPAQAVVEVPIELTPEQKKLARDIKIQNWLDAKKALTAQTESERVARAELTADLFPVPKKGTQRADIGYGCNIKLVHGWTYTLGDKDLVADDGRKVGLYAQAFAVVEKIRAAFAGTVEQPGDPAVVAAGEDLITRLFKPAIELSGSEYEKLDGNMGLFCKSVIDEVLIVKPASPQLTFEPPKPAK